MHYERAGLWVRVQAKLIFRLCNYYRQVFQDKGCEIQIYALKTRQLRFAAFELNEEENDRGCRFNWRQKLTNLNSAIQKFEKRR